MTIEQYLETRWVERNKVIQDSRPNVTVADQAKLNAVIKAIDIVRRTVQFWYVLYLMMSYLLIKLRLLKAPEVKSSLQEPQKPPEPPKLVA